MNKRVLVFDVETTGLIPKNGPKYIESSPYITQLCFIIYCTETNQVVRKLNEYVYIDDSIEIPRMITELTGIDKEICKSKGKPIEYILTELYNEYLLCDVVVAHNINFDKEMVMIEVIRNYAKMVDNGCLNPSILFNNVYNHVYSKEMYCTMRNGLDFCNIWTEGKTDDVGRVTRKYKKNPKLSELYYKIFNRIPSGLHDALVDTEVCLQCYIHLMEKT
jgi:DNA polymerase III epsilon subunit-like protein